MSDETANLNAALLCDLCQTIAGGGVNYIGVRNTFFLQPGEPCFFWVVVSFSGVASAEPQPLHVRLLSPPPEERERDSFTSPRLVRFDAENPAYDFAYRLAYVCDGVYGDFHFEVCLGKRPVTRIPFRIREPA